MQKVKDIDTCKDAEIELPAQERAFLDLLASIYVDNFLSTDPANAVNSVQLISPAHEESNRLRKSID